MDLIHNKIKHRYIVVYRPPNASFEFTCNLFACLAVLCNLNFSFTICGYFNMWHINSCNLSQNVVD